jgi:hypothetical protein
MWRAGAVPAGRRAGSRLCAVVLIFGLSVSAEIIVLTFRGSRTFALQLRDQQGTTAVLTPGGYPRGRWRLALATLAPHVMAPEVQRSGQISDALAGNLWRRR